MAESDDEMDAIPMKEEEEEKKESPEDEKNASLANPDVVTKYQEAAKIAQAALADIVAKCTPGARIVDITRYGDETIEERCAQVYKGKNKKTGQEILKGVAFPVCVSVNDCVCHCSPLESEADLYAPLAVDDMVKIDMGVHVDGFIAVVAHTCIVGYDINTPEKKEATKGNKDDVINATYVAAEIASKLIRAGNTNTMVTSAIKQVAEMFDVRPIAGTLMHQMKQYVVDGNKMILLRDDPDQRIESCTFEASEVYAIDIAMSSGDGKPKEMGMRTTVHKRAVDKKYALRNKASRVFFNEVNKRFPTMPFSLRSLPDEKGSKLGVRECVNHEILSAYPVLHEKKGDVISHTKFTVMLMPNGNTNVITGMPPVTHAFASDESATTSVGLSICKKLVADKGVTIPENIMKLLSEPVPEKKVKEKKDKKKAKK